MTQTFILGEGSLRDVNMKSGGKAMGSVGSRRRQLLREAACTALALLCAWRGRPQETNFPSHGTAQTELDARVSHSSLKMKNKAAEVPWLVWDSTRLSPDMLAPGTQK